MIAPEAWVETLDPRERASYDEIVEAGYSHEQAVDAIVRDREERAELVAVVSAPRPGAPGRRKRRAKNKVARASRKRNRR